MFSEIHVGGVLLSPIVVYAGAAMLVFLALRFVLGRAGLFRLVWHPALFELALFVSILSLLVRFF
jgi:hypothetical protein